MNRKFILVALIGTGALAAGAALLYPALTRYVDEPEFRAALEKETAKGLHFPEFSFSPIRRTGLLAARSDSATAHGGRKALTTLDAHDISAQFNPWGVFLRRWSIDDLHVGRAEIGIQVYEPNPEPVTKKPWFALFLPDRVFLKHVWSEHADITWKMLGQRAGIFDTRLVITPHGRDFNYEASGGHLRNPRLPELSVLQTHLLITKTLFQLYDLDLQSRNRGTVHAEGSAATRGDKNLDFRFKWNQLTLAEWLPQSWSENLKGNADGELRWTGHDYKLRSATLNGVVRINDAKISGLSFLDQVATLTDRPDLRILRPGRCRVQFGWEESNYSLRDIELEESGKYRITGEAKITGNSLGGKLNLGLARPYLAWLPHPEEVFPRESDGYLWTTIHLSGTVEKPQQDLSPRILAALKDSPSALLGAALRQFGAWLHSK
jgi:hypothetical protein